ncbi:MAG TPA: AzlD domain-containing protein [Ktedonobacteraceae bacterium]|jgi:branched-subunit amino acid transport protein|nr:AzlD domain-containing protein [Ktedonobacteraceae bacterium]
MSIWLVMLALGIITYAIRLSFILLLGKLEMPDLLTRAFRFVPIAALSALIAPDMFLHQGKFVGTLANPRLLAALLAILVAWRTRNALLTIGSGMGCLWLLELWLH